jgi:hypothetical protein
MENPVQLTPHFTQAVDYARQVHVELRKGTQVPYMAHLLGVASLVLGESGHLPFPVTEDTVIAALLHDAVEDEGKSSYVERLWNEPPETLLVSVADKLYNARDSNPRRMGMLQQVPGETLRKGKFFRRSERKLQRIL